VAAIKGQKGAAASLLLTGHADADIIDKDNMKPVQYGYLLGQVLTVFYVFMSHHVVATNNTINDSDDVQTAVVGLLESRSSNTVPVKGPSVPTVVRAKPKKDKDSSRGAYHA
jgi:hypothetical protein